MKEKSPLQERDFLYLLYSGFIITVRDFLCYTFIEHTVQITVTIEIIIIEKKSV